MQARCRRQFRKLGSTRSSFRNKAGHASLSAIVDIPPPSFSAADPPIAKGAAARLGAQRSDGLAATAGVTRLAPRDIGSRAKAYARDRNPATSGVLG
jgi:hypothetical protein